MNGIKVISSSKILDLLFAKPASNLLKVGSTATKLKSPLSFQIRHHSTRDFSTYDSDYQTLNFQECKNLRGKRCNCRNYATVSAERTTGDEDDSDVIVGEDHLELYKEEWQEPIKVKFVWLRDHCRSAEKFNAKSRQRTVDILDFSLDIKPLFCDLKSDTLNVLWDDGHSSSYSLDWIKENIFVGSNNSSRNIITWQAKDVKINAHSFEDYMNDSKVRSSLIKDILTYGFGVVKGAPVSNDGTKAVTERVAPITKTMYGSYIMNVTSVSEGELLDTAYTNLPLQSHTDSNYYSEPLGIQVFHSLKPAEKGGETILVDGFNIAKQFEQSNSEGYRFMSHYATEYENIHDDFRHYYATSPIFKHDPYTGRLEQFRYNVYDRAPLSNIPFDMVGKYYEYFQEIARLVQNPDNEFKILLEPGTVILLDNWRVTHGRTGFRGKRILSSCYISRPDFISSAKVLKVL